MSDNNTSSSPTTSLPEPKLISSVTLGGAQMDFYLVHKKGKKKVPGKTEREEYIKQLVEGKAKDFPSALAFVNALLTRHEQASPGAGLNELNLGWDDINDSIDEAFWKALPEDASVFNEDGSTNPVATKTLGAAIVSPIKVERIAKARALDAEIKRLGDKALEINLAIVRHLGDADATTAALKEIGLPGLPDAMLAVEAIMKQLTKLQAEKAEKAAKREAKAKAAAEKQPTA